MLDNSNLTKPYIPKNDEGYKEVLTIDLLEKGIKNIEFDIPPKPNLDHEIEMWDSINHFETESWSPKKLGLRSGFQGIDKAFDGGIKPGFIIVAADSNVGK